MESWLLSPFMKKFFGTDDPEHIKTAQGIQ
jgi:hypothetical protein